MSTERPLLVATPLVSPILRGEKTVTRRLIRWPTVRTDTGRATIHGPDQGLREPWPYWHHDGNETPIKAPCAVGDVLWVRETWRAIEQDDGADGVLFPDGSFNPIANTAEAADAWMAAYSNGKWGTGWRPSIHMPRWAARIFLRVEDVRVERVQDITEEDARAEGIQPNYTQPLGDNPGPRLDGMWRSRWVEGRKNPRKWSEYGGWPIFPTAREAFADLWDSLAPDGSKWADNSWVWRVAFTRIEVSNVR